MSARIQTLQAVKSFAQECAAAEAEEGKATWGLRCLARVIPPATVALRALLRERHGEDLVTEELQVRLDSCGPRQAHGSQNDVHSLNVRKCDSFTASQL